MADPVPGIGVQRGMDGLNADPPNKKRTAAPNAAGPVPLEREVQDPLAPGVGNRPAFRSRNSCANLTAGIFPYKKRRTRPLLRRLSLPSTLALLLGMLPGPVSGQWIFHWPIRSLPQPEAVLTGAEAVFWNPGSLAKALGTSQQVWIAHVDGPDVTGVRGVAAAGAVDLPGGIRGGLGYWHLGVQDIPRTTVSPEPEPGEINVAEDVGIVALARSWANTLGLGAALRFARGSVAEDARTRTLGDLGLHFRPPLPLEPRLGLALQGIGQDVRALAGLEVSPPSLAASRIPLRVGYGIRAGSASDPAEHRLSIRASWMEQFRAGVGFSYLGDTDGWVRLWMVGADIGRYSLSVLREGLPHGFGAIHFYRAAVSFP